jgi:hypothetical protein
MGQWPSKRASHVLFGLIRIDWSAKRQSGLHRTLQKRYLSYVVFAIHERDCWGIAGTVLTGLPLCSRRQIIPS